MLRRIICLAAAVLICVSSANAWTAESFTGWDFDNLNPYTSDVPMMFSMERAADNPSGVTQVTSFNASWSLYGYRIVSGTARTYVGLNYYDIPFSGIQDIDFSGSGSFVMGSGSSPGDFPYSRFLVSFPSYDWASNIINREYGPNCFSDAQLTLSVPVSSSASAISIGLYFPNISLAWRSGATGYSAASSVRLYVNGTLIRSYTPNSYFAVSEQDIYYADSRSISSIQLVFNFPGMSGPAVDGPTSYSSCFYIDPRSYISYSLLESDAALDAWNDEAQDAINQHDAYESQWTSSMADNFNKLNLSSYTFPVGLVTGIHLITGIFSDLWNAMGEYKIVYAFPLFLGIVLLLIGRISKFGGSQSSSHKTGDGDA